jgi:hypothetical protein
LERLTESNWQRGGMFGAGGRTGGRAGG